MKTHEAMTAETWHTVRLALHIAAANKAISEREYTAAMTEVTGTSEWERW